MQRNLADLYKTHCVHRCGDDIMVKNVIVSINENGIITRRGEMYCRSGEGFNMEYLRVIQWQLAGIESQL